jgi:hypothetical protein
MHRTIGAEGEATSRTSGTDVALISAVPGSMKRASCDGTSVSSTLRSISLGGMVKACVSARVSSRNCLPIGKVRASSSSGIMMPTRGLSLLRENLTSCWGAY